jgi:hypothetical protein
MVRCKLMPYTCHMTSAMNAARYDAMPPDAPNSKSSVQRHRPSAARPSISATVDSLIWAIENTGQEREVREPKSILSGAIDSYPAEFDTRLGAQPGVLPAGLAPRSR